MRFFAVCIVVWLGIFLWAQTTVLQPARFYDNLEKNYIKCTLCPNYCVLKNGETGICKARKNIDGELFSLVYNRPVAVHLDPIEKKPLFHFYPGQKILSIATAGCNLCCNFCQNWEISQSDPQAISSLHYSPEEIIQLCEKNDCQMIAFTYTEPTVFYEYMLDIAKLAKVQDMRTVLVSCGYINPEPLRELLPYMDAANIDLKGFSEEFYQIYTTGSLEPILNTIKIVYEAGVHLEITNLVIPAANDEPSLIDAMCKWILSVADADIPLHFSKFFPRYKLLNRPSTSLQTLTMASEIAYENGFHYVYIGNIASDKEDTFCPNCQQKLIDRKGYQIIRNQIEENKCPFCEQEIYGQF